MYSKTFPAEKINIKQLLPIISFILLPVLLYFFNLISLIVLIQFLLLSVLCIIIIIIWHFNTKIIITEQSISYRSVFKRYTIKWKDVKKVGTFTATGLTITEFDSSYKNGFFNVLYIYVTTNKDLKIGMVKKSSNAFIRFYYDENAYAMIKKFTLFQELNLN